MKPLADSVSEFQSYTVPEAIPHKGNLEIGKHLFAQARLIGSHGHCAIVA
jgi:hypothetical protein